MVVLLVLEGEDVLDGKGDIVVCCKLVEVMV